MKNTVVISSYQSQWCDIFHDEAKKIESELSNLTHYQKHFFKFHHIGSTSIPNMAAKPIIDILLECDDIFQIKKIEETLLLLNYDCFTPNLIPHYTFFTKKYLSEIGFHIHLMERGDPQIKRHIHFRDYLIHHPDQALEYAQLKKILSEQFPDDRTKYTLGKNKFIRSIDQKAKTWRKREKDFLPTNKDFSTANQTGQSIINAIEANITVHMTHFEQYLSLVDFERTPYYTQVLNGTIRDENFNFVLNTMMPVKSSLNLLRNLKKIISHSHGGFFQTKKI